jgi:hypothetical protein
VGLGLAASRFDKVFFGIFGMGSLRAVVVWCGVRAPDQVGSWGRDPGRGLGRPYYIPYSESKIFAWASSRFAIFLRKARAFCDTSIRRIEAGWMIEMNSPR